MQWKRAECIEQTIEDGEEDSEEETEQSTKPNKWTLFELFRWLQSIQKQH